MQKKNAYKQYVVSKYKKLKDFLSQFLSLSNKKLFGVLLLAIVAQWDNYTYDGFGFNIHSKQLIIIIVAALGCAIQT